jgi:hypothetical protein
LIENSTNKFSAANFKNSIEATNQSQKMESTYQKLQIFNQMEAKESEVEIDEE